MTSNFPSRGFPSSDKYLGPTDLSPRVAVVGPCVSGKTTLVQRLRARSIGGYVVGQEHSNVQRMFRLRDPDVVVFLDVDFPEIRRRRPVTWTEQRLRAQRERLKMAREHADLYLDTVGMTPEEVELHVIAYLEKEALL